jgi:hypothetical protein
MRIVYWLWYERRASLNLKSIYILPLAEADKSSCSLLSEQVLLSILHGVPDGREELFNFFSIIVQIDLGRKPTGYLYAGEFPCKSILISQQPP